ncbi:MAG: alpha-L-fucosidase [Bacteroidota bacterium]|nr:alpha-L-fucosidase [Bacteroidota bacterium]
MNKLVATISFSFIINSFAFSQAPPKPYGALPTKAQLKWHEMEMYCLIHFGVDTYTDKEWGYGDEDPAILNPVHFNAEQIVGAAKAGGFKGVVVVAKHHDGLCLWPTKTTEHNITKSPWKNGKGDIMKEYRAACDKLGMQLGVYCSPWDRNNPQYGIPGYITIYRAQLKELYSNYGSLFISWHDGANGGDGYYGGARELRKIDRTNYYGWDSTFAITRSMQPSAVIFGDIGPDVRWVGNEEGYAGETCWATFTPQAPDEGKKPANGYVKYWLATEGTKNGDYWMPAECDVPLRPGWFYHASQDEQVKSPYTLLDLYYKSVGRGAGLDVGIAPNREGLLQANDVTALKQFGDLLRQIFKTNLAKGARFTASNIRGNSAAKYGPAFLTDNDRYSYWATDDAVLNPQLIIDLATKQTFNVIRLRENIKLGQRITSFAIDAWINSEWKEITTATSIGANRLIRLPQNITTNKLRLRITGAGACIALSDFGLFKEPPHLTAPVISRDKKGQVQIITTAPVASIHYTLDGTEPTLRSAAYDKSFPFVTAGIVKARSFEMNNQASEISSHQFGLSKSGWKIIGLKEMIVAGKPENAIDEEESTFYSTLNDQGLAGISIDIGRTESIKAFTYLPRQDKKTDGIADKYIFSVSNDGQHWEQVAAGEFSNIKANPVEQVIQLDHAIRAQYFRFSAVHVISGNGFTVAELGVITE